MELMDFVYITPKEAALKGAIQGKKKESYYQHLLNKNRNRTCCNCDNPVWRLCDNDMCFCCTTGEADPSDDYELN